MVRKRKGVGKAHNVSGIPLSGSMSQLEGMSAEPNREEPGSFFQTQKFDENRDEARYARDYFRDEEERLGATGEAPLVDRHNHKWSEGLQDEANMFDETADEGELLEGSMPMHLDPAQVTVENAEGTESDFVLQAETVTETDSLTDRLDAEMPDDGEKDTTGDETSRNAEQNSDRRTKTDEHGKSSDSRQAIKEEQDEDEKVGDDQEHEQQGDRDQEYGEDSDSLQSETDDSQQH